MRGKKRGNLPAAGFFTFILITIILITISITAISASALDYYADVVIDVGTDGSASITGTANHPALMVGRTDNYTSKKGAYWLLDISPPEQFSDFIFKVVLPEKAIINYVKAPSQVRIAEEGNRLTITGTGKNEPFSLQIQYSFDTTPKKSLLGELLVWFGPALILIIIGLVLLYLGKKRKQQPGPKPGQITGLSYNPDTLTDRQKQILDLIQGSKTFMTQAMIERAINIPKSSVSRNIDSLVRKGILKKEKRGMSNILSLAK
jgi:uncharacterized membrane protein